MTPGEWGAAIGGAIAAASAGVLVALAKYMQTRQKVQDTTDAKGIRTLNAHINRLEKQVERCSAQTEHQQKVIDQVVRQHGNCRVMVATFYGHILMLNNRSCHMAQKLREMGMDPGPDPELPERPDWHDEEFKDAEFDQRTTEQNQKLLRETRPETGIRTRPTELTDKE